MSKSYRRARALEYPSIGDQLDAIWKYLATLADLPADTNVMLAQVMAVKTKNPKPEL